MSLTFVHVCRQFALQSFQIWPFPSVSQTLSLYTSQPFI